MPGRNAPKSVHSVKSAAAPGAEPDLLTVTGVQPAPAPSAEPVYTREWQRALGRTPDTRPAPGRTPGLGATYLAKLGAALHAASAPLDGVPVLCGGVLGVAADGSAISVRIAGPAGHTEVYRIPAALALELALQIVERLGRAPAMPGGADG